MYKKLVSYSPEQIFLIQGNVETFRGLVDDTSLVIQNVEVQSLSRFTVEDAKNLVEFNLERMPNSWCLVYFDVFMNDAAQTLLKTLEEPKEGIFIVFVTPHPYLIPQTIRSRVRLIPEVLLTEAPEYLKSKKAVQEYIKETFGSESDEDASIRRSKATVFLDALEAHVRTSPEKVSTVYEAKEMLFKANMPTKQVVEYAVAIIF
ncbi:MAG: hypothetical protein AAB681_01240 [Patescibacteria group bacterium]